MSRFVLLYHDCPPHYERPSHWDFMLESDQVLCTWALPGLPDDWAELRARTARVFRDCPPLAEGRAVRAERLGDHRMAYLQLEGPLSGDRGQVCRIDEGTYESEAEAPGFQQVVLAGRVWSGSVTLEKDAENDNHWTLTVRRYQ